MIVELRLGGVTLGRARLDPPDPRTGTRSGPLSPTDAYDLICPIFRLFADAEAVEPPAARVVALERATRARAALTLHLLAEDGRPLASEVIHVHDRPAARELVLEVHGLPAD